MPTELSLASLMRAGSWLEIARALQRMRAAPGAYGFATETQLINAASEALSLTVTSIWTHVAAIEAKDALAPDLDDATAGPLGLTKFATARTALRKHPDRQAQIRRLLLDRDVSRRSMMAALKGDAGTEKRNAASDARPAARRLEEDVFARLSEDPSVLGFPPDASVRVGKRSDSVAVDLVIADASGKNIAGIETRRPRPNPHAQASSELLGHLMLLAHVYGAACLVAPGDAEAGLLKLKRLAQRLDVGRVSFAVYQLRDRESSLHPL